MTKTRLAPVVLATMATDQFSVLRELTAELDRLSSGLPEIEMRRRNGVFRITARLPVWVRNSIRVFVEGQSLVIESGSDGSRNRIPLPAKMDPTDVGVRFFEGVLVVELPQVDW